MKLEDQFSIGLLIPGVVCLLGALVVLYTLLVLVERPLKEEREEGNIVVDSLIEKIKAGEVILTSAQQAEKMSALAALDQSSLKIAWGLVKVVQFVAIALLVVGLWQLWLAFYIRKKFSSKAGAYSSNKRLQIDAAKPRD
jgi:di/tricarboxylate transporter